jgi:hypothetical protein
MNKSPQTPIGVALVHFTDLEGHVVDADQVRALRHRAS